MAINELLIPLTVFSSLILLLVVFTVFQYFSIRRTNQQLVQLKDDYSSLQSQFLVAQKVSKGMGKKMSELQLANRQLALAIEELKNTTKPVVEVVNKPVLNTELFDNPENDLKSLMGKTPITH